MTDTYKQTTVSGNEYQRCHTIVIQNPYNQSPLVVFQEETIFIKPDTSVIHDTKVADKFGSVLYKPITDYNETFEIWNPLTQTKTGTTSDIKTVYTLIWSFYMNEALKRDAEFAKKQIMDEFNKQDAQNLVDLNLQLQLAQTQEEKDLMISNYNSTKQSLYDAALSNAQSAYDAIINTGNP